MRPLWSAIPALMLLACASPKRDEAVVARPDAATSTVDAAAPALPEEPPKRLFARKFVSKVRAAPSLDAPQLGYLRAGTLVQATTGKPLGHERCLRGWYEIAGTGGFVCDGREVTAFSGERPPDKIPTPADRDAALPYRYAYNRVAGTPMYKRLPSEEEALFWEDGIVTGDGGVAVSLDDAGSEEEAAEPDAGDEPSRPATLADLAGERGALVRRKLARGFHVSLDREFEGPRRRYWRTLSSGYIPSERMVDVTGSTFHGIELPKLPLAFVVDPAGVPAYRLNAKGRPAAAETLQHHAWFPITGEQTVQGKAYLVDGEGLLVRADQITRLEQAEPPRDLQGDERWMDVDLSRQTLVAYEGGRAVYATLVSTGRVRKSNNPLLSHETPTGQFHILSKHTSATMDGDHAVFGAYSLEDVPYVQFFRGAFALHGAFWHDRFGRPASHGCINLAPEDARWLFQWTRPEVPGPWHAAYPRSPAKGTRLIIRGTTPKG